ncbi:MAG: type 4a pilus biogenesis protein PilO [Terriglobia bacterium]
MAGIPKFNELSPVIQIVVILAVGAGLWAIGEYVWPMPLLKEQVAQREQDVTALDNKAQPLRPFRENLGPLMSENAQLELQLENLRRIVPDEKEVDNFVRLVQAEALSVGVSVRRFTARPVSQQEFYVEVPFEVEMDGPFYDVLQFYDRLARMERIINVSELRMGGTQSKKTIGQRQFAYSPNTTVAAICQVTTFFSTEGLQAGAAAAPGAPARPGAPAAPARAGAAPAAPAQPPAPAR